jgi:oligosaccharide repeat unit polymerase
MTIFLFTIFTILSVYCIYLFIRGKLKLSPLWPMLAVWFAAIGISQLHLSSIELAWPVKYWWLLFVSLVSFALGFFVFNKIWQRYPFWQKFKFLITQDYSVKNIRLVIYVLLILSLFGLYKFYTISGNFPLLAADTDVFRFTADEQVPGLYNYLAQLARIFIPLSFFVMFVQRFNFKKHSDLIIVSLFGILVLTLFASRTQIFFIDLWVMALYLFIRKPNWKQSLKFYPIFLLISIFVLAAVPLIRQYKSYGSADYLAGVTQIDNSKAKYGTKYLLPLYIGVSFNQQALLHAQDYYETHPIQKGKVTLDPFTNILGLDQFKSNFDLGAIFKSWWNTGTYLFPFVIDFGTSAFFFIPFIIAGFLTLIYRFWLVNPNFLSINLYAYAVFFIVMTVYLSFTVRAEMYLDLMLLFISYLVVSKKFQKYDL